MSNRHLVASIFIIVALIVIFQGVSVIDTDLPDIWRKMYGHPFNDDPRRLYLVEGLFPNAIGMLLLQLHFADRVTWFLWWALGMAALSVSVILATRNGSLKLIDLLLIITFSRLVDTLSMWIGRSDPYLLAFLVLSAGQSRRASRAAILFAAFCHPSAAIMSALGSVAVERECKGRPDYLLPVIAGVFGVVDVALSHLLVPDMVDRSEYLTRTLHGVLLSGAEGGLVTLVSALILPVWFIHAIRSTTDSAKSWPTVPLLLWFIVVAFICCVITLDHTRVACILTLAPLIVYLRHQEPPAQSSSGDVTLRSGFFLLATARLVVPHVAFDGFWLFHWEVVVRVLKSIRA